MPIIGEEIFTRETYIMVHVVVVVVFVVTSLISLAIQV